MKKSVHLNPETRTTKPTVMEVDERQALLDEISILETLLQWHAEHKDIIWDSSKAYEDYINAALDRIIEIKNKLNEGDQNQELP